MTMPKSSIFQGRFEIRKPIYFKETSKDARRKSQPHTIDGRPCHR